MAHKNIWNNQWVPPLQKFPPAAEGPSLHLSMLVAFIVTHPTQIFTFEFSRAPCLSGNLNFLHFPSIICMYVVFELKGKRKKGRKLKYMC